LVGGAVVLEGVRGGVGLVAVGLDDHALVGLEEVDPCCADLPLGQRGREVVVLVDGQEAVFEVGAGRGEAVDELSELP
jgi:hypothetical protein